MCKHLLELCLCLRGIWIAFAPPQGYGRAAAESDRERIALRCCFLRRSEGKTHEGSLIGTLAQNREQLPRLKLVGTGDPKRLTTVGLHSCPFLLPPGLEPLVAKPFKPAYYNRILTTHRSLVAADVNLPAIDRPTKHLTR